MSKYAIQLQVIAKSANAYQQAAGGNAYGMISNDSVYAKQCLETLSKADDASAPGVAYDLLKAFGDKLDNASIHALKVIAAPVMPTDANAHSAGKEAFLRSIGRDPNIKAASSIGR